MNWWSYLLVNSNGHMKVFNEDKITQPSKGRLMLIRILWYSQHIGTFKIYANSSIQMICKFDHHWDSVRLWINTKTIFLRFGILEHTSGTFVKPKHCSWTHSKIIRTACLASYIGIPTNLRIMIWIEEFASISNVPLRCESH